MSNFFCENCKAAILEGEGGHYVTGCEHYPVDHGQAIKEYEAKGFRINCVWKGEYILMMNRRFDKVRLYECGRILESDPVTGEYRPIKD